MTVFERIVAMVMTRQPTPAVRNQSVTPKRCESGPAIMRPRGMAASSATPAATARAASLQGGKALAVDVVDRVLEAVRNDVEDVYPDAYAKKLKQRLDMDAKDVERKLAAIAQPFRRS